MPILVEQWFAEFETELLQKPKKLNVKSHLVKEDLINERGYQKFEKLSAKKRYPSEEVESQQPSPYKQEVNVLAQLGSQEVEVPMASTECMLIGVQEWSLLTGMEKLKRRYLWT